MAGEEVLHGLGHGEFDVHPAAVAERHDKETNAARGFAHPDGTVGPPIDLSAFAGGKGELMEGLLPFRADLADEFLHRDIAACKALLPEALKDLSGGIWVRFHHFYHRILERVELAGVPDRFAWQELLGSKPPSHGAFVKAQLPGDLAGFEPLLLMQVA